MLKEVKTEKDGIINLGLPVEGEITNKPGFWVVNTHFCFAEILAAFTKAIANLPDNRKPSSVKNIRTFNGNCSFPLSNNLQTKLDTNRIKEFKFSLAIVPRENDPKDAKICLVGYLPKEDNSETFII